MKNRLIAAAIGVAMLAGVPAVAAELLNVTVNSYQSVRLSKSADVIMVANPAIADVVLVSPRQMFVLGRQPGETNLYVLDDHGEEILQTEIVVVPRSTREVIVQRGVEQITLSCAPRCAEVPTAEGGSATAAAEADAAAAAQEAEAAQAGSGG